MNDRIAVIGAGQMGNGIAHVFAQSGFPVTIIDVSAAALDKAVATIGRNLERQVKKGTSDAAAQTATAMSEVTDGAEVQVSSLRDADGSLRAVRERAH